MLEINYGIIATVAAAAVARCYMKFVRGPAPKSVDMSGKVRTSDSNNGHQSEIKRDATRVGRATIECRARQSEMLRGGVQVKGPIILLLFPPPTLVNRLEGFLRTRS